MAFWSAAYDIDKFLCKVEKLNKDDVEIVFAAISELLLEYGNNERWTKFIENTYGLKGWEELSVQIRDMYISGIEESFS